MMQMPEILRPSNVLYENNAWYSTNVFFEQLRTFDTRFEDRQMRIWHRLEDEVSNFKRQVSV